MKQLVDQIIYRPAQAFAWSLEILGLKVQSGQMFDAIVSRVVHSLNRPAVDTGCDEKKSETGVGDNRDQGGCCG